MRAMTSNQSLHMNQGDEEASYARNSTIQHGEQDRMKPMIEVAVTGLLKSTNVPRNVVIADLGCSSGPNALALVSTAVDAIFHHYVQHDQAPPEVRVLLNDLPDNDFNSVAKSLVVFQQSIQTSGTVLTGIVPGSFYTRLFTSSSVDLVVSSSSLQWLSEAPEDLKRNRITLYDNDEDIRRELRPLVVEAYRRQFRKDFTLFLKLRAQELVPGGRMVISLLGSSSDQYAPAWDIITCPLNDMASRGLISRERFDCFYIPLHTPSEKELREIIEDEGSLQISQMQVHEMDKGSRIPKVMAHAMRAIFEPMIVQHFALPAELMDDFVKTLEQHLMTPGSPPHAALGDRVCVCVSLTKF
ncbi:hypothetical protein ACP70R_045829 [Stipagrostis hirtigluma subsp. patula]